jgi:hypothetical protein
MTLRATDEESAEVVEYLEWQLGKGSARKVVVRHVEKITAENITGDRFEVWNCVTNQGKWWVVTPMMNFYTQRDFKSADVVLTFHVGMVGRVMSQDQPPLAPELRDAFSEPWRKWEGAVETMRVAQEAEDFQAVGMRLREAYISMLKMVADGELAPAGPGPPQSANPEWMDLLADKVASGSSNARLRAYLKSVGKETWQHVNWLTHATKRLAIRCRDSSRERRSPDLRLHSGDSARPPRSAQTLWRVRLIQARPWHMRSLRLGRSDLRST